MLKLYLQTILILLFSMQSIYSGTEKCLLDLLLIDIEQSSLKPTTVQSYMPPSIYKVNSIVQKAWEKKYNIKFTNIKKGMDISTAHMSTHDLILDSIVGLTKMNSNVGIIGFGLKYKKGERIFQRNINNSMPFDLIIITEEILLKRAKYVQSKIPSIIEHLAKENKTPIIIIRQNSNLNQSLLSNRNPNVIETIEFKEGFEGLTNKISLTIGHPEIISHINNSMSYRNHFIPLIHQQTIAKITTKKRSLNLKLPKTVLNGQKPITASIPEMIPDEMLMDTVIKLKDFIGRDKSKTLDLGIGQPHIELAPQLEKMMKANYKHISKEHAQEKLSKSLKQWYLKKYAANLNGTAQTFASNTSSAIEQIIHQLPEGTTIYVPDYSYSGFYRSAKLKGVKVKTYNPLDDSIMKLNIDKNISLIITNYPHNPTGKILNDTIRKQLHSYAQNGTPVFNDLSYTHIGFDGNKVSSIFTGAKNKTNLLETFSGSKDLGLTEVRISLIIGDPKFITKIKKSSMAEHNKVSVRRLMTMSKVMDDPKLTITTPTEMQHRKDNIINFLREIGWPEKDIVNPKAGLNVMAKLPNGTEPWDVVERFWREAGVFVAPDTWFVQKINNDRFLRISLSEPSHKTIHLGKLFKKAGIHYNNLSESKFLNHVRNIARKNTIKWSSTIEDSYNIVTDQNHARKIVNNTLTNTEIGLDVSKQILDLGGSKDPKMWNEYFKAYDKLVLYDPNYLRLLKQMNQSLHPTGVTIDIGSGTGNFSLFSAIASPKRQVIGIDFSSVGLKISQEKAKMLGNKNQSNLNFVQADGAQLPTRVNKAKNIIVNNTLYAIPDKPRFLREIANSIHEDGIVYLHDFFSNKNIKKIPIELLQKKISDQVIRAIENGAILTQQEIALLSAINSKNIINSVEEFMSLQEFTKLAKENGLEIIKSSSSGYLGGTQILLKKISAHSLEKRNIILSSNDKKMIRSINIDSSNIKLFTGTVHEAYQLAANNYKKAYPKYKSRIDEYFAKEVSEINPKQVDYIIVQESNEQEVIGFARLIDGTNYTLPIEIYLPGLNLRSMPNGIPTNNVIELGRLSTKTGPTNVRDLLRGMVLHLKNKYQGVEKIPHDLNILGLVENERLVSFYERLGFRIKHGPKITGRDDRWVMEYSAKEMIARYLK